MSQLNFFHKIYVQDVVHRNIPHVDKSDLARGGNIFEVPLLYGPTINHHIIEKYFGEETQETNMENQDDDKDVLDILYDMLKESKMYKENDDYIHEDVEEDIVIANDDVVKNHDHAVEDEQTMCEDVISKGESLILVCVLNRKVYRLFQKGIQFIDDITPHNEEDYNFNGLDMGKVVAQK